MRQGARTVLVGLGLTVLVAFAYAPVLRAGLAGGDYRRLVEAGEPWHVTGGPSELAPLLHLSLRLSRAAWGLVSPGPLGLEPALYLHLEALALVGLAAAGLGFFARRLALPWTGSEHAVAAAWAAAVVFLVHPLAVPAVAVIAARETLLGTVFGVWASAAFLRGRQDREYGYTAASVLLCVLGGFASPTALGLPFLLAGVELVSAHRYRPWNVRLRTATTTLVVFGAAASLYPILRVARLGPDGLPASFRALRAVTSGTDAALQATGAVEELGLLILPSNPWVLRFAGTALAGAVFLLAMQPGFVAARSAPRLWGRLSTSWLAVLLASEVFHAHVRVSPADLSRSWVLLPSVAVMACGIGLGATALSGARRLVVPWVVAVGYASLAHGNALPWLAAAERVDALRADLLRARELHGTDARLLVIDPPRRVAGVEPLGEALTWLVHPDFDAGGGAARATPDVRGLSEAAFLALLREPEFDAIRAEPFVLLLAEGALDDAGASAARSPRRSVLIEPASPSGPPRSWRGELRSPALELDPLRESALIATVGAGDPTDTLREVGWLSSPLGELPREGTLPGVWLPERDGARGIFDLGGSLRWRLSGRVRLFFFPGGTRPLQRAEVEARLPELGSGVQPERDGDDWLFPLPDTDVTRAAGSRAHWVVGLFDLASYEHRELRASVEPGGRLRSPGAAALVADIVLRTGAAVAWTLDCRVEELTIARARGRRIPATGEPDR